MTSTPRGHFSRSDWIMLALVALGGMGLTVLATSLAWQRRDNHFRGQLITAGKDVAADLDMQTRVAWAFIDLVAGFFEGSVEVTEQEFAAFSHKVAADWTALVAVEWQPAIKAEDRAAFEQLMQSRGHAGFRIRQRGPAGELDVAPTRPVHLPVVYAYDPGAGYSVMGLDAAADPARMASKRLAVEEHRAVVSAPFRLPRGPGDSERGETGVAFESVVLRPGDAGASPQDSVAGYVSAVFSVREMVAAAIAGRDTRSLVITLHDGANGHRLLHQEGGAPDLHAATDHGMSFEEELVVPGRLWTLQVTPARGFVRGIVSYLPWATLGGGSVATILLTLLVGWRRAERGRHEAEAAARLEGERRFHEVVDRLAASVVVLDALRGGEEFVVHEINASAARLTGTAPREAVGRRVEDLLPGRGPAIVQAVRRAWTSGAPEVLPPSFDELASSWLDLTVFRLPGGQVVLVLNDFTVQKSVEHELRNARNELEVTLDATGVGLWWWNPQTRTIRLNARGAELSGLDRAGTYDVATMAEKVHPDDLRGVRESFQAASHGRGEMEFEFRCARLDGTWRRLCCRVRPLPGTNGEPALVVGCTWDVTERRAMEEHLQRVQRIESVGTLASGVAHNLNNALAPIAMGLDLLRRNMGGDSVVREALEAMTVSVRRAGTVVRQLAALTRGAVGRPSPITAAEVLAGVRDVVAPTLPPGVELRLDVPTWDLPVMQGDEGQLRQALLALCSNARDAMPDGGRLEIGCRAVEVSAENRNDYPDLKPGGYLAFAVADTGIGIPVAVRNRIFDPFFTTKEVGRGTGLGLPTVLGIARAHGGGVVFESTEGRGSRFALLIPAGRDRPEPASVEGGGSVPAAAPASPPSGRPGPAKAVSVLVVDDEPPVRDLARRALQMEGFQVFTASDGKEAVALFASKADSIDVVVIDMVMPVMDGASAAAAMVRLRPGVPVIAASGFAAEDVMDQARRSGVIAFLQKPFSVDELVAAVRTAAESAPTRAGAS